MQGLGLGSTNMTNIYQLILVMFNGTSCTISVQKIEEPLLTNQLARTEQYSLTNLLCVWFLLRYTCIQR